MWELGIFPNRLITYNTPIYVLFFDFILPVHGKNTEACSLNRWILSVYGEKRVGENPVNWPIKLWKKEGENSVKKGKGNSEKRRRKLLEKKEENSEKKEEEKSGKKRGRKL